MGGLGFFMNKRGQGRGRGGGEGRGAGHFNMCAETINPQRGQYSGWTCLDWLVIPRK